MKRCPTCQKTFADSMKFCQTDGTPLVEDQASAPPEDPYKTVVGSIKDDDLLQIPEAPYDPMKTMVTSDVPKAETPKPEDKSKDTPKEYGSESSSKSESSASPKPADSSLNAPSFGDLSSSSSDSSGSTSSGTSKPPKPFDATFSAIDPPSFGTPKKGDTAPFNKPSDAPFGSPSKDESPFGSSTKDDAPPTAFGGTPFETPKASSVPPPYKEPESFNPGGQSPFGQQSSDPWGSPQTPFGGQQANDPFGGGQAWTPPPAPVSNWQEQGINANTPFQPPVAGAGQDQTLAIVSLVCGILSLCACGILTGIPALITGYMAKNNVDSNPGQYGGRGMAMAGMILGGISVVFTVLYVIFVIISAVAR